MTEPKQTVGRKIADDYLECIMETELTDALASAIDGTIDAIIVRERLKAQGLVDAAKQIVAWEKKYPSSRIFSHHEIIHIADELTAIVAKIQTALQPYASAADDRGNGG